MQNSMAVNPMQSANDALADARLPFRRQFILGPANLEISSHWTQHRINETHCLAAHPDLEVHQAGQGDRTITLLGYILDPDYPKYTNADIVESLLGKSGSFHDLLESTCTFGGRWILIFNNSTETILFTDAAGLRQLYYSLPDSPNASKVWCATTPSQLGEALHLELDSEALDFLNSCAPSRYGVYWLPGDVSPYKEIKLLLPNHFLNLRTGKAHRYWPHEDLGVITAQEAIVESARLMRGLMTAARLRFDLALSMTAGWDSRIMLALSKEFVNEIYIYTINFNPDFKVPTNDVIVPATLIKKLGAVHHVLKYSTRVNAKFEAIYYRYNTSSHKPRCGEAQALYENYPQERVCITGDIAEIVKCHFRPLVPTDRKISAQDLARFDKRGEHPFLLRTYEAWLSDCPSYNVNQLDLFCWEHMAGRIQALIRTQNDLVQESFAPFNCRSLLLTMLSVDDAYRKFPEQRFLRELIEYLWPEVLSEPINPPDRRRAKNVIADLLIRLHFYQMIPESIKTLGKRIFR